MSPPSKPATSPAPPQSPPPPLSQEERQELITLRREKAALSIYLWNLVQMASPDTHEIEVSSSPHDPLWCLAFAQPSDPKSGKAKLLAGTALPITEQERKRVVRLLRGSTKPMFEALEELKLMRLPASYVEEQITPYLAWNAEKRRWESLKPTSFMEKITNAIQPN